MPKTRTDAADVDETAVSEDTAPDASTAESVDIEALKAQIRAEIIAENKASEAKAEAQAEKSARVTMAQAKKDLVEIELFQDDDKYKDDLFVSVNGERYQIKRGVRVNVPRFVADTIEASITQDRNTAKMITRYEKEYSDAVDKKAL